MTELLVAMRELLERCLFRLSADPDNLIDEDRLCDDIRLALTVGAVVMTEDAPPEILEADPNAWRVFDEAQNKARNTIEGTLAICGPPCDQASAHEGKE